MQHHDWQALAREYKEGAYSSLREMACEKNINYAYLCKKTRPWRQGPEARAEHPESAPARVIKGGRTLQSTWQRLLESAEELGSAGAAKIEGLSSRQIYELAGAIERIQKGLRAASEEQAQGGGQAFADAIAQAAEQFAK